MAKIVVGVNTLTEVEASVYSNHCQFWFRQGRSTKHDFLLNHPRRMAIDRMRNVTAKMAIDSQADYILFVDDDVLIPINTVDELISCDADIAVGWTIIRGYPFENMFFRWIDAEKLNLAKVEDKDFTYNEHGDIPVDAVGFSCALIKMDFLKKITSPYFITGPFNTEDIYFCIKGHQQVKDVKYVVNPRVLTSHNIGPEYLDPIGAKHYKKYFETICPEVLPKPKGTEEVEQKKLVENVKDSVDFTSGPSIEELMNEHVFGVPLPVRVDLSDSLSLEDSIK